MSYKVIDNFLEEDMFRQIKVKMESQFFPWFYEPEIAKKGEKVAGLKNESHFYLAHMFYQYYQPSSQYWTMVEPILGKLNAMGIIRVKGNLYQGTPEIIEHPMHVDFKMPHKGALFYINTNDGYTKLEDGTKINSVANRILLFDSSKPHCSTTCSDQAARMNININYYD